MDFDTINDRETMDSNAKPLHAGRYRIVKRLGQGGMGSVWLAEDVQLDNRLCAIKTLPDILASNKRAYRQLKEEALMSMKLAHPNIVTLRAFEENNGNPFLVMDYIDGKTLDDYLGDRGTLPEEEVIKLLKPIAEALDYAHKQGVVHRDIKPANVMISNDGHHPYILDFGIAREIQETMTRVTGKLSSGTLLYMSPEQLNGESPKAPQDIYSFGAMVYECLKGEPPFIRGQIEHQILNNEPTPLAENITISKQVQASLAKNAEDRPTTCLAVLGADEHAAQAERETKERAEKARKEAEEAERQRAAEEAKEAKRIAEEEARRQTQAEREAKEIEEKAKQEELRKAAIREAQEKARREALEAERQRAEEARKQSEIKAQEEARDPKNSKLFWVIFLVGLSIFCGIRFYQNKGQARQAAIEQARMKAENAKRRADEEARAALEAHAAAEAKIQEEKARQAAIEQARREGTGEQKTITLPGGATMEMIYVGPGEFMMGNPTTENGRHYDETQHCVRLTKGYWLSKYEVTQAQWESVMGINPSHFKGAKRPVDSVSWNDCQEFIKKVNARSDLTVRLPTEAEWEYACRAGSTTAYSWGNALNGDKANCKGNYPYGTTVKGIYKKATETVGSYKPNAWGFYDMHGNVLEWCQDWGDWLGDYSNQPTTDPKGPASGNFRVLRGGSWDSYARLCRSASRFWFLPDHGYSECGFRLACSAGLRE